MKIHHLVLFCVLSSGAYAVPPVGPHLLGETTEPIRDNTPPEEPVGDFNSNAEENGATQYVSVKNGGTSSGPRVFPPRNHFRSNLEEMEQNWNPGGVGGALSFLKNRLGLGTREPGSDADIRRIAAAINTRASAQAQVDEMVRLVQETYRADSSKVCRHYTGLFNSVAGRLGYSTEYRVAADGSHVWSHITIRGQTFVVDALNHIVYRK
jgi:hypothetical protein